MSAKRARISILLAFIASGMLAVLLVPEPYGPSLGLFLVVFGMWFGRWVSRRMAPPRDRGD